MAKFEDYPKSVAQVKLKETLQIEARQMASLNIDMLKSVDAEVLATVEAHPLGGLTGLNFAIWMYYQGISRGILKSDTKIVVRTIEAMHERGVDFNSFYSTGITAGHLLADCHGDIFSVNYTESRKTHREILLALLEFGLDVNIKDDSQQSSIDYANQVEERHGLGTSMFLQTFKPWALNKKMQGMLVQKSSSNTKKAI